MVLKLIHILISGVAIFSWAVLLKGHTVADDAFKSDIKIPLRMEKDVVFRDVDGAKLRGDLFRPDDDAIYPLVLMVHGGAWSSGDKWELRDHARELAQAGYVAFSINYRLAPDAQMAAQLEDCREALRFAIAKTSEWNADPDRVGAWGYSAGAHLVSMLALDSQASDPPLKAVVAGGAPCDFSFVPSKSIILSHVMGGTKAEIPEVYQRYSPLTYVTEDAPPFFIFHGSADLIVPQSCGRRMFDRLSEKRIDSEFYSVPGKGHLLSFLDLQARRLAIQFLDRHLKEDL